jgi:hypothetical protein
VEAGGGVEDGGGYDDNDEYQARRKVDKGRHWGTRQCERFPRSEPSAVPITIIPTSTTPIRPRLLDRKLLILYTGKPFHIHNDTVHRSSTTTKTLSIIIIIDTEPPHTERTHTTKRIGYSFQKRRWPTHISLQGLSVFDQVIETTLSNPGSIIPQSKRRQRKRKSANNGPCINQPLSATDRIRFGFLVHNDCSGSSGRTISGSRSLGSNRSPRSPAPTLSCILPCFSFWDYIYSWPVFFLFEKSVWWGNQLVEYCIFRVLCAKYLGLRTCICVIDPPFPIARVLALRYHARISCI